MVHALAALDAVVDDAAIPRVELLLLRNHGRGVHEMSQKCLMLFRRLGQSRETGANLRDHQEVRLRLRVDVPKASANASS